MVVSDAGGGAGTWQVELAPQAATAGASVQVPSSIDLAPGGTASVPLIATVSPGATEGTDYGFVLLRKGTETRRVPYLFLVTRPAFEGVDAKNLDVYQVGTTKSGPSRANIYRYPEWAFGPPSGYTAQPPMDEAGGEKLYTTLVKTPIVNLGVAVIERSTNAIIDPFFLGSPDQNDVQGYAGTPVNVNGYMFDYHADLRGRRRGLPAAAALLGGGRLGLRPVHGPAVPRRLPAEAVEERRHAAGGAAHHDARLGRGGR